MFGRKGKVQPVLCVAALGGRFVTGTATGHLYVWDGAVCQGGNQEHDGPVTALWSNGNIMVSGGMDGKVKVYDGSLIPIRELDLAFTSDSLRPAVRSVWLGEGDALLAGTRGAEIYLSQEGGMNKVLEGHFEGESWGLAAHPNPAAGRFATAGDDATVRVWSTVDKQCLMSKKFNSHVRALSFSPDGSALACGTGGGRGGGGKKNEAATGGGGGMVLVLDPATLEVVAEVEVEVASKTQAPATSPDSPTGSGSGSKSGGGGRGVNIQALKYSPDGASVAVGCQDGTVYLLDVAKDYSLRAACPGHTQPVTQLDFTADCAALQSTGGGEEIMYWDAFTGEALAEGAQDLRDADWASWSSPLGWPVQGVWPEVEGGGVVNTVDRSGDGTLLACGDESGTVRLVRYPCVEPGPLSMDYLGQSAHVTAVRWTAGDSHLISLGGGGGGGGDHTVFQWRLGGRAEGEGEAPDEVVEEEEGEGKKDEEKELDRAALPPATPLLLVLEAQDPDADSNTSAGAAGAGAGTKGDEFQAIKPWQETTVPPSKEPEDVATAAPDIGIELAWVHGYQAQSLRNSVAYTSEGDVVYTAATVGIVYNREAHSQSYFLNHHTSDIISLAVSKDGQLVATGERGRRPMIYVWDANTRRRLACLTGHRGGVGALAFSYDGSRVASVGLDGHHTILVHDWRNERVVAKQRAHKRRLYGIEWSEDDASLCTVGEGHVAFWGFNGRTLSRTRGVVGPRGKLQTMLCVVSFAGKFVTGQRDGTVYIWDGGRVGAIEKAHEGAVYTMHAPMGGDELYTGGQDGRVLQFTASFDPLELTRLEGSIRSVCARAGGELVVGTSESEIWEVVREDVTLLHEGHHSGEVWAMASHPVSWEVATAGDDKVLRLWGLKDHRCVRKLKFGSCIRALGFSPDGGMLALGMGSGAEEGSFKVLNAATLDVVHTAPAAEEWIQDLKFSPDGATLALASHDCNVYLFDVAQGYTPRAACSGHISPVEHLDFTSDSTALQSSCGSYELLYWDVTTGDLLSGGAQDLRDAEWASWTCTLGWPVQGVWPTVDDGTVVNAVDQSKSGRMLATGDEFGRVKVFSYPCLTPRHGCLDLPGHSAHVTNVRWGLEDECLLTLGGSDRTLFQWHVESKPEYADDVDSDLEEEGNGSQPQPTAAQEAAVEGLDLVVKAGSTVEEEDDMQILQSLKSWVAALVPPTEPAETTTENPEGETLKLEWIHGYRAHDTRSNLFYLTSGEIVYHSASVGVVYKKTTHTQRFYFGHTGDIISLALHPDGSTVATGAVGRTPEIHVWDTITLTPLVVLSGFHLRGVASLTFSPDGTLLVSTGRDEQHSVAVYDWAAAAAATTSLVRVGPGSRPRGSGGSGGGNSGSSGVGGGGVKPLRTGLLATAPGHNNAVLDVAVGAGGEICLVGENVVKFWLNGIGCKPCQGLLGSLGKVQMFASVIYVGDVAVVGTVRGELYLFQGNRLVNVIKAHEATVSSLFPLSEGGFVSGGKDGFVKEWDGEFNVVAEVDMGSDDVIRSRSGRPHMPDDPSDSDYYPGLETPNGVRSVCQNDAGTFLVGLRSCEILEVASGVGHLLHESHCFGESRALATHPSKAEYVTAGDDKSLRIWDVATRRLLRKKTLGAYVRSVAYNVDGSLIAVGLGGPQDEDAEKEIEEGAFLVLNATTLIVVHQAQDSGSWISDIKFSLDGAVLAVGSTDSKVYLYDVYNGYAAKGVLEGHNHPVTHLDFSLDSTALQSTGGAEELMYWNVETGEQVHDGASKYRDMEWATWTSPLGWPVQGIWPEEGESGGAGGVPGALVNAVDRSKNGDLLAIADNFGRVKLVNYPCITPGAGADEYRGHALVVSAVRWTCGDAHLISVGGGDHAVFQWRLNREEIGEDSADEVVALDMGADDEEFGDDADARLDRPDAGPLKLEPGAGGAGEGDEFGAVKAWVAAVVEPTTPPEVVEGGPEGRLVLDWVHGYQAQAMRNSVRYTADGGVVYTCGALAVNYDSRTHTQRHCTAHTDDVISLAMSPDGRYAATGEVGVSPKLVVWSTRTMKPVAVLEGKLQRGVGHIAFSSDGRLVAGVGMDLDHTIAVYDWASMRLVAQGPTDQAPIYGLAISPDDRTVAAVGDKFCGFFQIWNMCLKKKTGVFGRQTKIQPLISAAYLSSGDLVTGGQDGNLYLWRGGKVETVVVAHGGKPVYALYTRGANILSGGGDGRVVLWNAELGGEEVGSFEEGVRSVCISTRGGGGGGGGGQVVLVGTQSSQIWEVVGGENTLLQEAHTTGEVWGLATAPRGNTYATAGDDRTVRLWSASRHRCLAKRTLSSVARSLAYSPDGARLVVGLGGAAAGGVDSGPETGSIVVLNALSLEVEDTVSVSDQCVRDVKFSPDGATLAVACQDTKIYIFDIENNFSLKMVCTGHADGVTHLDFSADSAFLQSCCASYEMLFWEAGTGEVLSGADLRDAEWDSWTCTLGWPVQGVWPRDGTVLNAVDRRSADGLIAGVDEFGQVRVYNYPCATRGAAWVEGRGHSAHVTNVRWTNGRGNEGVLVTVGGKDRGVFQWKKV